MLLELKKNQSIKYENDIGIWIKRLKKNILPKKKKTQNYFVSILADPSAATATATLIRNIIKTGRTETARARERERECSREWARERCRYCAFRRPPRSPPYVLLLLLLLKSIRISVVTLSKTHSLGSPLHYQSPRLGPRFWLVIIPSGASRFVARTSLSYPEINDGCLRSPKSMAL